jgi:hypothetical protein
MPDDFIHPGDGIADAEPGDVPASRLALLLILIFVATSCAETPSPNLINVTRPNPEPALPADCDPFVPPAWGVSPPVGAPALAEWTRIGGPDAVIALTGSRLSSYTGTMTGKDTRFEVFGQNAHGSFSSQAALLCLDGLKAAVVLPAGLPADSEYMIWPVNAAGTGSPAVINATEAWWIGPNAATRGDTVSVYGRNLAHESAQVSHIYIQQAGAVGVWAEVTAANPYKVDFTVPRDLADGDYQVWVHNGRGGHYGWSGPLTLTINDGMPWTSHVYNVKAYGAKGDGVTDDEAAIESAVEAAGNDPWSTIYLPTGTYMVSRGFAPPSRVRWLGDGATKTFIKANAGFVAPATGWDGRAYCLLFTNSGYNNIAVEDLTLDANGNLNGYLAEPIYLRFDTDIRFSNVTINAKGYSTADFHGSTRLSFQNCDIIGGGNGIFFGSATQIAMDSCRVYGTNDVNTMLTSWGGDSISFTNTTGQDYDNTTVDGWAQGRFIYGSSQWGSNRNIYIGNCTTKALAVRPGCADQNSGEQLSWESGTHYSGTPVAATAVTFGGGAFFTDPGLQNGQYDAVIVNGTGLGQHRKIVACSGTTVTVAPEWNVAPDTTSTVIIAGVVSRCAVYHNSLQGKSTYATQVTASAGIQPYGNSYDFIADGNSVSQVRNGIYLWGMAEDSLSPKSITCVYFNYVANNVASHCLSGIVGVSQAWEGWPATDPYPGISYLANTCSNNSVDAMTDSGFAQLAQTAPLGDQVDLSVFDHNAITNTPVAMQTESNGHISNTLTYGNSPSAEISSSRSLNLK